MLELACPRQTVTTAMVLHLECAVGQRRHRKRVPFALQACPALVSVCLSGKLRRVTDDSAEALAANAGKTSLRHVKVSFWVVLTTGIPHPPAHYPHPASP